MSPITNRNIAAIITVGLVTFILGLLLAAFAGDIFGRRTAGHSAYSRSFAGHHALVTLLEQTGINVVECRNPDYYQSPSALPLLLLEPVWCVDTVDPDNSLFETNKLEDVLENALENETDVVFALPKYKVTPSRRIPNWIESRRLLTEHQLEVFVPKDLLFPLITIDNLVERHESLSKVEGAPLGIDEPRIDIGGVVQVLALEAFTEPLLWCDEGVLIGRISPNFSDPQVYLVSDPGLFNNGGLARGDHAPLVHSLIAGVLDAEGVIIDESLHGFTSGNSLMPRIFSFPMILVVIHAFLVIVLAAWAASRRFGKPLEPPPALPPGKELLLDNTAGLLLATGNHGTAVRGYLQVTMASVADRFYLPEGSSRRSLMGRLKSLSEMRGLPFELDKIERTACRARLSPAEALRLSHRIHDWRKALTEPAKEKPAASRRNPVPESRQKEEL